VLLLRTSSHYSACGVVRLGGVPDGVGGQR